MKDKNFIIERQILRIGNKISNGRDKDLIPFDLTANQSEALLYFDNCPGRSIIDLKEHLRITHQAARNLVERMKRKELLYVVVSEEDGRFKQVYLTEKGRTTCHDLKHLSTNVGCQLLKGLSEEEKDQLLSLLLKINDNV